MGLSAIYPGPNLSKRHQQQRVYPYLLKGLSIQYPNHVWGIDITYIRLQRGWMYLVAILDWYSRYVVSWELDQSLEIDFVLKAVKRALAQSQPIILNSDQGSHFTSPLYIDLLKDSGIKISMDSKGRALDNIFTDSKLDGLYSVYSVRSKKSNIVAMFWTGRSNDYQKSFSNRLMKSCKRINNSPSHL